MNENKEMKKKRLGALDIFIIIAIAAAVISVGVRMFTTGTSDLAEGVQLDEYIVYFDVYGIRDSSAKNNLKGGEKFYLKESDENFGTMLENITIKDAENYYEMPDGSIVLAQNNATGDLYKVDVEAAVSVRGKVDADGRFLLNGNRFLGAEKELQIYSKYVSLTVKITDVVKAQ